MGTGPVGDSLFAAVGRSFCACPHSGNVRLFRICHLHTLPNGIYVSPQPGSYHIRPHSSHFGNSCLVFVNFLPLSNRRFPYLGLVGIFAAQIIHFGFLFQFVRQVTSRPGSHTHAISRVAARGHTMPDDVTTTLFFAHILPHRVSC